MKKLRYLFASLAIICGVVSCNSGDKESQEIFDYSPSSINFGADGGTQTVYIYSSSSWSATRPSQDSWYTITPSSTSGDGSIQVTAAVNDMTYSRNSVISIYTNSGTYVLNVYQAANTDPGGETLSAPTGVNATKNGSSVNISWNAVTGATSYFVYRSSDASGSYSSLTSVSGTTAVDAAPLNGYNYYKVKASNGSSTSDFSSYAYCNYSSGGGVTIPAAPTGVVATQSGTSININWNSVSGAANYKIYWSYSSTGTKNPVGTSSNTNYKDDIPAIGSNYYWVTAVNSAGESDYSSYTYCNYSSGSGTTKPNAPTGVVATQSGTSVKISWNSVSGATGYKVYYSNSANGTYSQFVNSTSNTNWTDPAPYTGANYYKIKAFNSAGDSDFSSYAYCNYSSGGGSGVTKLNPPTSLEAYSGGNFVQISFNEVPLAYSYELYRATSASGSYSKITASGGSISGGRYILTDSNPRTGTSYYKVKAVPLSSMTNLTASDLSNYVSITR